MRIYRKNYIPGRLLLILSLLSVLFTACDLFGGGNTSQHKAEVKAPHNKQTYTIPEVGLPNVDLDTLDPALAQDAASISAIQMIYTGLAQLDNKLQVQPQLAKSWTRDEDGVTWTFHLKPNLKFSDGAPLTSTDVAYSIDRALQPATQSQVAPIYLKIIKDADQLLAGRTDTLLNKSILTPDATTIIIITAQKATYFPAMLTHPCSYVVEKSLIQKYDTKFTDHLNEGGGAGPFKVAQYTHHTSITFTPNNNYYNQKPQLQQVKFAFYHSAEEAYQDYKSNQIDMAAVPINNLASEKSHKDFFQVPQLWTNYYAMNYQTKPFNNINIRQAFALAINKEAIAKTIWKDTVIATNNIVPKGMIGYNPNLMGPDGTQKLQGNPTLARNLLQQGLKEEGWGSVSDMPQIKLTYVSNVAQFDQEIAALVQTWQKVLNITVVPDPINDYNSLLDKVTASTNNPDGLQMWGLAWVAEYPDPQDWLTLQFGKGAVNNNMNYGQNTSKRAAQQQVIQQQLEDADGNPATNARIESYQQAEQQIVKDAGWIPMEQVTSIFLRNPNIIGIVNNGQNLIAPDDWATIYRIES